MASSYQILNAVERTSSDSDDDSFAMDVLVGLSAPRKSIPSKYFYDARGSELFRRIADLPEYYLSRCEREILTRDVELIVRRLGHAPFNLVELGPGCCDKTRLLLEHLSRVSPDFRYVPIDISESSIQLLAASLDRTLPRERVTGLVADYHSGLRWLGRRHRRRNLVLFLGSSVGNFTPQEAGAFMARLWGCLAHGDLLLIGFDLKKDIDVLLRAYNDSQGVTAEFNLNLLARINRELGGHFRLDKFRHFGTYNAVTGAMESYLVSTERQSVWIEEHGRSFSFEPWEPVHTEYSYKYSIADIEQLARANGFQIGAHLYDERRFFVDSIWQVDKPDRASRAIEPAAEEGGGSALDTGPPEPFIQRGRAART
jgi:L-histidine N-alpha-methyltransferase